MCVFAGCAKNIVQSLKNGFLLDSAATQHMCNDPSKFISIENCTENKVLVGDGKSLNVSGKGDILLNLDSGKGNVTKCRLKDVLYVPKLSHNLLSVPKISEKGKSIIFSRNSCNIIDGKKTVAFGRKVGKLYVLSERKKTTENCNYALSTTCLPPRRVIKCRNFNHCCHASCIEN